MIFAFVLFYVSLSLFGIALVIGQIGKPREPMTGGVGVVIVLLQLLITAGVLWLGHLASNAS